MPRARGGGDHDAGVATRRPARPPRPASGRCTIVLTLARRLLNRRVEVAMNRSLPLLLTLAACSDTDIAYVTVDCEFSETTLAWDDPTPLGATANELLAPYLGAHQADGVWSDGGAAVVSADVAAGAGEPALIEVTGGADAASCGSSLSVPVAVAFATDDGAFAEALAEAWVLDVDAAAPNLGVSAVLEEGTVNGSYAPDGLTADEWGAGVRIAIAVSADGALSGSVVQTVNGDDGSSAWDRDELQLEFE
jgi:hypothetical protein